MSRHITHCTNSIRKHRIAQQHHRQRRAHTRHAVGLVAEALEQRVLLSLPTAADASAWAPFAPVSPTGSLVYQSSATGSLASPAENVPLALNLDAGQRLSLLLQPGATLQPQLEVRDPAGILLASCTGGSLGQAAWLQTLPVSAAGTYQILLRAASGSGNYTLQATLNAALEAEPLAAITNNTPAIAQDLDGSFLELGGNARRTAVLGRGDTPGALLLQADFTLDAQGFTVDNSGGGLWHLSMGHGSEPGHSASQSFYYGRNENASGGGTYNTGTRNTGSLFSPTLLLPPGQSISLSFNYLLRTESSNGYDLAQLQINAGSGWSTLASYNRTAESSTWKNISVDLSGYAGKSVQLRWFFDTRDAMSNSFEGWYVDDVKLQCAAPSLDYYSFTLQAGETASVALKKLASGTAHLAITDAAGTVLAQGSTSSGNLDEILSSFQALSPGRYYVRLSSDAGLAYQLMVLRNAVFDCEPNNSLSTAQDLTGSLTALGSVSGSDSDYYSLRLAAGERMRISTRTPGDGTGEFANGLQPRLELYDASGRLVANNDHGAADGHNASLVYQSVQGGTFKVRVGAVNGSSGEYVLQLESLPPSTATPGMPDLLSDSDTGFSSTDNITRLNSGLRFLIGNTVAGATVSLWADGQLVGSAVADASSTLIASTVTASLADGVHQFTATQQLPGQEASAASPALAVTIDTAAPAAPGAPVLQAGSDTGLSSSDRITQDTTPSFSIFASPYYRVYRNGTKISGDYESYTTYTAPVQAEGSWEYALTALDTAGNESAIGTALSVTIDVTAPSQPAALDLQAASDSGASNNDNVTNQATLGFDVAASPYYRVYRNGALVSDTYQAGSSFQLSGNPEGACSFTVCAVDAAGNISPASGPLIVTVDTVAPAKPATPQLQPGSDSGVSNSDNLTNNANPTIVVSASEPGTIHLDADGAYGRGSSISIPLAGNCSLTLPLPNFRFEYGIPAGYATGSTPAGVVTTDLNLDGKLDLAVACTGGIALFLGRGDGTFSALPRLATAGYPDDLVAVDLNKDGNVDLVATNPQEDNVSIFLGKGGGSFQPERILNAGDGAFYVAAADFNGDGKTDLAVTNVYDRTLSIFLGRGDGTFQPQQTVPAERMARNIRAADVNADGKIDLVVGNVYSDLLSLFIGRGDGTFAPPMALNVGGVQTGVGVGDVNSDGKMDLIALAQPNSIAVLLGNGDGTFASRRVIELECASTLRPECLVVADLNGDGSLDVAAGSSVDSTYGALDVALGNGDGTFGSVMPYRVPMLLSGIDAGDFNGDGKLDLVTTAWGDPSISVFLAQASSAPQGPHSIRAWLEDLAGNRSMLSDALNVTLDTSPADNPTLFDLQAASDTGSSSTDNYTDDRTPTFDVQAGPYFRVYRDGVQISRDYESGSTYTPSEQAEGTYTYSIRSVDAAGNVSSSELKLQVTIASMLPLAPDLIAASDTGISSVDNLTRLNNSSPASALSFRLAPVQPGATITLFANGLPIGSATASASEVLVVSDGKTALADGQYAITWQIAIPSQPQQQQSPPLYITIDTQSPAAPGGPQLQAASDTGISSTDRITQDTTPTFVIPSVPYYRLYRNGAKVSGDYESSATYTTPVQAEGGWNYAITAVDAAGNESTIGTAVSVTIDVTAPDRPAPLDLLAFSDSGISNSDNITQYSNPTFNVSAAPFYRIYRDGTLVSGLYQTGATYEGNVNGGATYGFTVVAVDAAGNTSAASDVLSVTVDNRASVPSAPDLQAGSDTGISSTDNLTNLTQPTFEVVVSEAGVIHLQIDGDLNDFTLPVSGAGQYTVALPANVIAFRPEDRYPTTGIDGINHTRTGDVNGDGRPDLLVDNDRTGDLVLLLAKADGTFQAPAVIAPGRTGMVYVQHFGAVVADFNGDGKADVLTTRSRYPSLLLGNGDGTFQPEQIVAQCATFNVSAADVDGDGKMDLLVPDFRDNYLAVLLGKGDGTFQSARNYVVPSGPANVRAGDLNKDGKCDLVVTSSDGNAVSVFLGAGNGTFNLDRQYTVGMPVELELADLNGDGNQDMVVVSREDDQALVFSGNGDGSFRSPVTTPIPWASQTQGLVVTDFDHDGKLDLAMASWDPNNSAGVLFAFPGNGDGTFQTPRRFSAGTAPLDLCTGDFNGDGWMDLASGSLIGGDVSVLLAQPTLMTDGPHRITAWFEDLAGNVSNPGDALTITLDTTAPTASIAEVIPNPLTGRVDSITLTFSEPVTGLDLDDLKLSCDGGPNLLSTTAQTLTTTDNRTWTLGNLAALTGSQGAYTLTLAATGSGITDRAGNALIADVTKCFALSNTPPVIQPIGGMWGMVGKPLAFRFHATDSDLPAQSLTFELLDGPAGARVDSATGLFSWTPTYNDAEEYAATIRVTDSGSPPLSAIRTIKIVILDAVVSVEGVKTTPSGFDIAFHTPIDIGPLNLYDGTDAAVDLPDLTVVGQNTGPVHGSVVLDGIRRTLHWVKTGGPMVPDTYTLTLFGRPDGFYTLDIDGDGIAGGNYVTTAQWSGGPARVLSLPDIARGPSQSMQLPIRIDNAAGMQNISFEFSYDPALLSLGDIAPADLPPGWLMTSSEVAPGRVVVAAHGTIALSGGAKNLFQVNASVPANALYGAAGLLKLDNVKAGESIAAIGDTAVQVVACLGDASGNKSYSGVDAAYMANVSIGVVSGFDAFPLIDPVIIGDVNGNGSIGGLDASYVAQKSVGMNVPQIPDLPAATPAAPLAPKVTATTNSGTRPVSIPLVQRSLLPRIQRPALIVPWVRKVSEGLFSRRAIEPQLLN